jgi:N-acetylmuramoyl-L-alanine amidase
VSEKPVHSRGHPILIVMIVVSALTALLVWRDDDSAPAATTTSSPSSNSPAPTDPAEPERRVGYVISRPGALYSTSPGTAGTPVAGNVVFAVVGEEAGGFRVLDVCNREGWLAAHQVTPGEVLVERSGFADAAFVIDPGHGFPDLGAVGPTRLLETEVNLDVSERIAALLRSPRNIDWATGAVTAGNQIPAADTVVLTRAANGPNDGDYEAGLTFRATLGNTIRADAIVSIHHNSGGAVALEQPGAEAYVSNFDPESQRLGGLIVDELRRSFARYDIEWTGASGEGVFARIGTDGEDYYTLLEVAEVPAAIVEAAYISNPAEEALAWTEGFRQEYANAVYRALVRFITTEDDPIPKPEVQTIQPGGPSRSFESCVVPPAE